MQLHRLVSAFALACLAVFAEDPFLEGDGMRALALDYRVTPESRVEVDFALTRTTPVQQRVFGADDSATAKLGCSLYVNSAGQFSFGLGDVFRGHATGIPADTRRHLAVVDFPSNRVELVTGGVVAFADAIRTPCTRRSLHSICVLGRSISASGATQQHFCHGRIYGMKVFERGRLVRNYRPIVKDGVGGLLETVTGREFLYAWRAPHWELVATAPGALVDRTGHVQGICISTNAVYFSQCGGIAKTDWRGRLVRKGLQPIKGVHTGDVCWYRGRIYAAVCCFPQGPFLGKEDGQDLRGCIQVYDEDLNLLRQRNIVRPPDGIACIDGVLYVGLGAARMHPDKPWRGNWYGLYDAETLATLREPFMVDHGYDSYSGVQNMATDGESLYVNYYVPDENPGTPNLVRFDRGMKVLDAVAYGYGQGFDFLPGGKGAARRFVFCSSVNWLAGDPDLPVVGLLTFAEWGPGGIRDITRHNHFPVPFER